VLELTSISLLSFLLHSLPHRCDRRLGSLLVWIRLELHRIYHHSRWVPEGLWPLGSQLDEEGSDECQHHLSLSGRSFLRCDVRIPFDGEVWKEDRSPGEFSFEDGEGKARELEEGGRALREGSSRRRIF